MSDHKLAEALRDAQEQPFEDWWEREGQFARSGGGQYEKTFAWNAWCAALAAHEAEQQAGEAVARVRVTSVTPGRFDEIDVLRPLPQGEYLLFAQAARRYAATRAAAAIGRQLREAGNG